MELASVIDKQVANKSIVELFVKILRDNDNEASVALFSSLLSYVDELDLAGMSPTILPVVLEISEQAHWRVKCAMIKLLPSFGRVLGVDEFAKKLFPLINTWLGTLSSVSVSRCRCNLVLLSSNSELTGRHSPLLRSFFSSRVTKITLSGK